MNNYVFIFGPPRSGTSWLGQIFNSSPHTFYIYQLLYFNRNKFTPTPEFLDKNFHRLIRHSEMFKGSFIPSDPGNLQAEGDAINYLNFPKEKDHTHVVLKHVRYHHLIQYFITEHNAKVIGLVRNPLATINSWLNAPKEFKKGLDPLKEWYGAPTKNSYKLCYEYAGYQNWERIVRNYLKLKDMYPENFKLVKYSDLLGDTAEEKFKELFKFSNIELGENTTKFINNSHSKTGGTYSVFRENKITDDGWKETLMPEIRDEIINLCKSSYLDMFLEE
tara:strand:+ start:2423 stop:3250 length:828 start_codon:yes stop_codon:yes gene_type:complete